MILALAYTYSQDNRRRKVNFFIIQLEAKWLPWAMLLATLVLAGPNAMVYQGTGILAAHLYDFLTRLYPTFGGGGLEEPINGRITKALEPPMLPRLSKLLAQRVAFLALSRVLGAVEAKDIVLEAIEVQTDSLSMHI
ncbi:MAG: hypothetical protein Q9178_000087 [Gyalolechia marmorata]